MPKLKKEYSESRKKEIIKAAWDIMMEKGYEKTTMREIARRIDATTGVLYTYYKNKSEILLEMQAGILKHIENVYKEMDKRDSVREAYSEFFKYEFKYPSVEQAKKFCRAMVGLLAEALSSEDIRKLINASFNKVVDGGSKIIQKGIKNGEVHTHVDPKAVIGFFYALEWGIWMQIAFLDGLNVDSYIRNIRKILMGNVWRDHDAIDIKGGRA
jgi:AcrR family transcriptional regulator